MKFFFQNNQINILF